MGERGDELIDGDFAGVHELCEEREAGFREVGGIGVVATEIEEGADAESAEIAESRGARRLLAAVEFGADAVAVIEGAVDERRDPFGGADTGGGGGGVASGGVAAAAEAMREIGEGGEEGEER